MPSRRLHANLVTGKHRDELLRIRSDFAAAGRRTALVLPAFERLAHVTSSEPGGAARGDSRAGRAWARGPCRRDKGCEMVGGFAVPRTFATLRRMSADLKVVDVLHRRTVRSQRWHHQRARCCCCC